MKTDAAKKIVLSKSFFPICDIGELLEKDGGSLYFIKSSMEEFEINEIAYYILSKCNGRNSITDILEMIESEYEISNQDFKSDMLTFMHDVWRKGLLFWNGQNPFEELYVKKCAGDIKVKRIFATEITDIIPQIRESIIISAGIDIESWYQYQNISRLEKVGGEYYFQVVKENDLKGILAISPVIVLEEGHSYTVSFQLNLFYMTINENSIVNEIFNWIINHLYYIEDIEMRRHENYFSIEIKRNPIYEGILVNYGFVKKTANVDSLSVYYERIFG